MNKRMLRATILISLVVALVFGGCLPGQPAPAAPAPAAPAPEAPAPAPEVTTETVKLGFLVPLSGYGAAWGLPGWTGLNVWMDEVNASGGIVAGNHRYMVDMIKYDTEMVASKALIGARKLVLEEDVDMLLMLGAAPAYAVAPFAEDQKMLVLTSENLDMLPSRPYQLSCAENFPFYDAMATKYIIDANPEIQRIAVTAQDDVWGIYGRAATKAVAESTGTDIVYDTLIAPDAFDFAPIVSAVLASEPDLICLPGIWPEFRLLFLEQAHLQGYEGIFTTSEWEMVDILTAVPKEFMEGSAAGRTYFDEPTLPAYTQKFYADWLARYGPGGPEDQNRDFYFYADYVYPSCAYMWQYGIEQAGSADPTAVRDALLASTDLPHMLGTANWWGQDLYGVNYGLVGTEYISVIEDGVPVTKGQLDFYQWWEDNRELVIKYYAEEGVMWWQQE